MFPYYQKHHLTEWVFSVYTGKLGLAQEAAANAAEMEASDAHEEEDEAEEEEEEEGKGAEEGDDEQDGQRPASNPVGGVLIAAF